MLITLWLTSRENTKLNYFYQYNCNKINQTHLKYDLL